MFGRIVIDRSLPINIIFFDGHRAEAIAAKSVPNMARKVSLPETSVSDSLMIKSDQYKIGRVMKPRGHCRIVRNNAARFFKS